MFASAEGQNNFEARQSPDASDAPCQQQLALIRQQQRHLHQRSHLLQIVAQDEAALSGCTAH
jgi:hypothetical protein